MSLGHIERDIRLLEDVVACQITPTEVIVLVKPGADPEGVGAAVSRILVGAAAGRSLKVLGGTPAAAAVPLFRRRAAVIAGTAGAAVLAAATVAAAVSGVFESEAPTNPPEVAVGPPATSIRPPRQGTGPPLSPGLAPSSVTIPGTESTEAPEVPEPGARTLPTPRITPLPVAPAVSAPALPAPLVPAPAVPAPLVPAPQVPTPALPPDDGYPLQPPTLSPPAAAPAVPVVNPTPVVVRVPLPPSLVDHTPPSPAPAPVPGLQLAGAPECEPAPPWGPKALGKGPAGHGRWIDADDDCDTGRLARWRKHGRKNVDGGEEDTP